MTLRLWPGWRGGCGDYAIRQWFGVVIVSRDRDATLKHESPHPPRHPDHAGRHAADPSPPPERSYLRRTRSHHKGG